MEENTKKRRITNEEIYTLMTSLITRFDEMDLNGAARYLREFGYFLRDNPDYLPSVKKHTEEDQEFEVVKIWINRKFGWIKHPKAWVAAFVVFLTMGIGYALGSSIVSGAAKMLPPIIPHIHFGS